MQLLVLRWQAAALSAGCGVGCVPCWELGVIRITSAYKTDPQILLHLEQGLYPLARFNFNKYFKFVNRENKLEQGSPFGARKSIIQSY